MPGTTEDGALPNCSRFVERSRAEMRCLENPLLDADVLEVVEVY
jgi:hypothetical protein